MSTELSGKKYYIIITLITILALILRLIHFVQNNSFYGDEVNLLSNIKSLDYTSLLKGLDGVQASPPVFLLISKFVYETIKTTASPYMTDLYLRLFPLFCGILSIYLFYLFSKLIFENQKQRIIAYLIFSINTQTIAYCSIFKQYTTELATGLLLYIVAYKIVIENRFKWYYSLIISSAIWLSYSSIFILLPLIVYIIWKRRDILNKTLIPLCMSIFVFYELSFKYILASTYKDMIHCWDGLQYGYLSFMHPARIFIRIGEFFVYGASSPYKIAAIFCGILIFYAITAFILSKENSNKLKLFLIIPLALTLLVSFLHKYPVPARLILFLYPLIAIMLAGYTYKFRKVFLTTICLCAILSALYYIPELKLPSDGNRNMIEYHKGYLDLTKKEDCIVDYQSN